MTIGFEGTHPASAVLGLLNRADSCSASLLNRADSCSASLHKCCRMYDDCLFQGTAKVDGHCGVGSQAEQTQSHPGHHPNRCGLLFHTGTLAAMLCPGFFAPQAMLPNFRPACFAGDHTKANVVLPGLHTET